MYYVQWKRDNDSKSLKVLKQVSCNISLNDDNTDITIIVFKSFFFFFRNKLLTLNAKELAGNRTVVSQATVLEQFEIWQATVH